MGTSGTGGPKGRSRRWRPAGARAIFASVRALRILLVAALLVAPLVGCGRDLEPRSPGGATIPVETFVHVMGALSSARAETYPDTAEYARRRAAILEARGITRDDVVRFVEVHGRNDERMAPIYQRVGARLDSLMQARAGVDAAASPIDPGAASPIDPAVPPAN